LNFDIQVEGPDWIKLALDTAQWRGLRKGGGNLSFHKGKSFLDKFRKYPILREIFTIKFVTKSIKERLKIKQKMYKQLLPHDKKCCASENVGNGKYWRQT
jgi:hypothetical protein